MPLDFAITARVTLLAVVDPVGLAPTFLAVTEGLPRLARRDVVGRASLIAGATLIGTALLGDLLLRALGISRSRPSALGLSFSGGRPKQPARNWQSLCTRCKLAKCVADHSEDPPRAD